MMSVRFSNEVEQELKRLKPKKWELFRSRSLVQAIHFARNNGWKEKKVQVRVERQGIDIVEYTVEPFDDCKCPAVLRYEAYYGVEEDND
jgi:mRNA-degrading endonuclease RelE of RelBE toxin-antitoxin system